MHTIRLKRPWNRQHGDEAVRVDVPDESELTTDYGKTTTYSRRFNRPSGLNDGSRVYLDVEAWQGSLVALRLNGQPLATGPAPLMTEIKALLQPHNQIEITLSNEGTITGRLSGQVSLRIEEGE